MAVNIIEEAKRLKSQRNSYGTIAKVLGVPKTTVYRWLSEAPTPASSPVKHVIFTKSPSQVHASMMPRCQDPIFTRTRPTHVTNDSPFAYQGFQTFAQTPALETPQLKEQEDINAGPAQPTLLDPLRVANYALTTALNGAILRNIAMPILGIANGSHNTQSVPPVTMQTAQPENPQIIELKQIIAQREVRPLKEAREEEQKKLLQQKEKARAEAEERAQIEELTHGVLKLNSDLEKKSDENDQKFLSEFKAKDAAVTKTLCGIIDTNKNALIKSAEAYSAYDSESFERDRAGHRAMQGKLSEVEMNVLKRRLSPSPAASRSNAALPSSAQVNPNNEKSADAAKEIGKGNEVQATNHEDNGGIIFFAVALGLAVIATVSRRNKLAQ